MSTASDEYYRRYIELQSLIERLYVDIYSLQEVENYNKSVSEDGKVLVKSSYNILGHICELLKADLGLTIWKIYSDTNNKSNTIKHLGNYICLNFPNIIKKSTLPKMALSSALKDVESSLMILRKSFLAHNDVAKKQISIQIEKLIAIVEELRYKLNSLCFKELDTRVTEITDKQLVEIKMSVSFGLGLMIKRSTFQIKNTEEKLF